MLQGSLEDFALEEILSLLAETSKSGQLDINGDRGNGALTIRGGQLADARASKCDVSAEPEDVMFELLRYSEGSFVFSNQDLELTGDEKNIGGVLSVAEGRLADWNAIAAVVPSLHHMVVPSVELPKDEVTIDRSEWAVLTVVASGCKTEVVCDTLELGEVEGCRKIKHLIERGLLELREPGSTPAPEVVFSEEKKPSDPPEEYAADSKSGGGVLSTPAAEPGVSGDSLVASLRGGTAEPLETTPPIPPSPLAGNGSVATAEPLAEESGDGEGLLMRYLRGEED